MNIVSFFLFLFFSSGNPAFLPTDRWPADLHRMEGLIPVQEEVDQEGHNRQWWRDRVQEWKGKKEEAQQRLARATEELMGIPLIPPTQERTQKREALREEIQTSKAQIEEADRMLNEQLPEEARKAGAPPGWLRD